MLGFLRSALLAATPLISPGQHRISLQVMTKGVGSLRQLDVNATEQSHAYSLVFRELRAMRLAVGAFYGKLTAPAFLTYGWINWVLFQCASQSKPFLYVNYWA